MDAYELLEIKGLKNDDQIDILVKSREQRNMTYLINYLIRGLEADIGSEEKIKFIEEILGQFTYYATACECIETEQKREEYQKAGMPDVEILAKEKRESVYSERALFNPDGKSAYRVLNLRNEKIQLDREGEIQDINVRKNTLSLVKLALNAPLNNMDEIYIMVRQLLNKMWAYSKLATRENRLKYTYQLYAQKGIDACGEGMFQKQSSEDLVRIFSFKESYEDYEGIEIHETGDSIEKKGLTPYDDVIAREYVVIKKKSDGREVKDTVYSVIDMEKLDSDTEYASQVLKSLSDEKIALSKRVLGRYIGEIIDGELKFSLKRIGLCKLYSRKNREQTGNIKTCPVSNSDINPDPDDDFDIN